MTVIVHLIRSWQKSDSMVQNKCALIAWSINMSVFHQRYLMTYNVMQCTSGYGQCTAQFQQTSHGSVCIAGIILYEYQLYTINKLLIRQKYLNRDWLLSIFLHTDRTIALHYKTKQSTLNTVTMEMNDIMTVNVYNIDWTQQHGDHCRRIRSVIELSLRLLGISWTALCLAQWTYRSIAMYLLMARKAGLKPFTIISTHSMSQTFIMLMSDNAFKLLSAILYSTINRFPTCTASELPSA